MKNYNNIPEESLIVYHNNKPAFRINDKFLEQQKAVNNLDLIKLYHSLRLHIRDEMTNTNDKYQLIGLDKQLLEVTLALQEAWNLPIDVRYHKFWNSPKCTCPWLDNEDAYGTEFYIRNANCVLHGE